MKSLLSLCFLLLSLLIHNCAQAMDQEHAALTASTPKTITFFQNQKCPRIFRKLSSDLNGIILDTFINRFDDEPTRSIHKLLFVRKSLTKFILDHQNTLRLTKQLSWVNKTSDENAIKTIQTKTAREIFMTQKGFEHICKEALGTISKQDTLAIKTCKTDINFTYGMFFFGTQLIEACHEPGQQPILARWLLETGADTTVRTYEGSPIVIYLLNSHSPMSNKILTYFFASPFFDINHYYSINRSDITIKITILQWFFSAILDMPNSWKEKNKLNDQQKKKLKQLQLLLDNGADPELQGSLDMTPLMVAQASKNKIFIDMFKKAIVRKEKIQKNMKKIHNAVADGTESLEEASKKIYYRHFVTKKERNNSKRLSQADLIAHAMM